MAAIEPFRFASASFPGPSLRHLGVRNQGYAASAGVENPVKRTLHQHSALLATSLSAAACAVQKSRCRSARPGLTYGRASTEATESHHHALVKVVKVNDVVGFGLIAPRGASAGNILVEEPPLHMRAEGERIADSVAAFKQMTPEKRSKLLSMAASPGSPEKEAGFFGDELHFVRVIRTNAVAIIDETGVGAGDGVYELSCRANHSCKPNASLCAQKDGTMHLKALRDLLPGEDIQVSYIGEGDLLRPTGHRRKRLGQWGFLCQCERCTSVEDTRGFQCAACGAGIMKYEPSDAPGGHRWGPCNCCQQVLPEETLRGAERQWEEHVLALRPSTSDSRSDIMSQIALAMYDGLISSLKEDSTAAPAPDAHWIPAKLARLAAEELIKQGRDQDAVEAVRLSRRYMQRTLGNVATRASAFATYIEAAALVLNGNNLEAAELCQAALDEAALLPRNGDELSKKIQKLLVQALSQKQQELTLN